MNLKDKADSLVRSIVRKRGYCECPCDKCGGVLTAAHIVRRGFGQTRFDPDNFFCLCWFCHDYFTNHPNKFKQFIESKIGRKKYEAIKKKALAYGKINYPAIIDRLEKAVIKHE